MGRWPCKALILFVFGMIACGETRSLRLEYESLGGLSPDLILIAKKSPSKELLSWSTDLSGLMGYSQFIASEADFVSKLSPCAEGVAADDCNVLGVSLGQLFGSGSISLDQPASALLPDIDLSGDASLFVFFLYNAFSLEASLRCFQLRELEVQNERFRLKGQTEFLKTLSITLAAPGEPNCFSFSAGL